MSTSARLRCAYGTAATGSRWCCCTAIRGRIQRGTGPLTGLFGREQRCRRPCVSWQGEGRVFELRLSDAEPCGLDACLATVAYAELSKDGRDVVIDRLLGDDEALGDLRVAESRW